MCPSGDSGSITVCLVGGHRSSEGQVEIRVNNGTWRTICDPYFSIYDARVICRTLGYGGVARTTLPNAFGPGEYPPLFSLECSGDEESIQDCPIFYSSCLTNDSAGVECYGQWLVHAYTLSSHSYILISVDVHAVNYCVWC